MNRETGKTMPYSLEAEQSLLGCMLIDNETVSEVFNALGNSGFYVESHVKIYEAVRAVYADRKAIDLVTLSDKLDSLGNLELVGGMGYLIDLNNSVPSAANYKYYLEIVKRDSLNRNIMRTAGEISEYARTSDSATKSIQYAESKLYAVTETRDAAALEDLRESGFNDVLIKFNALATNKDAYKGVQTGFFRLDRLTNGLQKSDLIIIAARPGMGKTSFAMNIVEHAAVYDGKICAVFSLEMSRTQLKQRLLCSMSGVSMSAALSGKLTNEDWKRLTQAERKHSEAAIYIDDTAQITPAEILSKCRRIKSRNGGRLDLIMIDYIQLMISGKSSDTRAQEVASITRDLKLMAKELDVPVIALSQLKRTTDASKQQLSDLRESGAIEQDADIVMFINRPDVGATDEELKSGKIVKGTAELKIAKHRNGETGKLPLRFKGETVKFVDAEKEG